MKVVFTDIGKAIRWSISLGNKFIQVVPWLTLFAVVLSVSSQFFLLIGLLLPLKVVLLLGSDGVPGYFPSVFQKFGREGLVLFLSAASVIFYALHLLGAKLVEKTATLASDRLLARSRKLVIFDNQQDIATKGYQRYSQSLATVTFVSLCLAVMAVFYGEVAAVILAYVVVCVLAVASFSSLSETFAQRLPVKLGSMAKTLGGVGFLVMFAFIVLDHLYGSAPGIIISVISLLLGRQAFGRMAGLVKDIQGLYGQRAQLAALFFHGRIFLKRPKGVDKGIWGLIAPEVRDEWVGGLLEDATGFSEPNFHAEWFDLGLPDVLCYKIEVTAAAGEKQLLVKVFNANRFAWARHEATLLTSQPRLPAVSCVLLTEVHGLPCHVFDITGLIPCAKSEIVERLPKFRRQLCSQAPPDELTSTYMRSHPQVWQRVDPLSVRRMGLLLDARADIKLIERLLSVLADLKHCLKTLPLAFGAPDIRAGMLWKNHEQNCFLLHWAVWNIEPIGTNWPIGEDNENRFSEYLSDLGQQRAGIADLNPHSVRLAAIFSQFEFRLSRGRYLGAYALVSSLLAEYEQVSGI
ncbi:hypothetical protein [Marinobacter qingdaonensis]|uniref:Uncharacterized protein n=1 Tax=Marinobacter qingdaonensis TaxID=3108486 RepID=A0ABU5P069_9GAMM|nr:hypothetical protein [Marinobacter sp. ASW11-75]MEA1081456.1 hypothetical protein [Marinobacter sp. ASW11-75]